MIVRRDRIHHQGKTNRDFKMLDSQKNTLNNQNSSQDGDRITSLSIPKNKKFSEILDQKSKRIVQCKDPVEETRNSAKKFNQHHLIGYPRFSQLEEKELMKRVFCGDSNTLFLNEEHRQNQESPIDTKCIIDYEQNQNRRIKRETSIIETRREYNRDLRDLISRVRKQEYIRRESRYRKGQRYQKSYKKKICKQKKLLKNIQFMG
ncbi:unnamed protein product [Paramecium sonneborni]|uniref:Uncharacterized protein n=1 Tax=Paramecium sonneborni TaxID=65129 RepID=A0A8S1K768_9CILI|nr:unnamed protein product [Paramecium sonneborni]